MLSHSLWFWGLTCACTLALHLGLSGAQGVVPHLPLTKQGTVGH